MFAVTRASAVCSILAMTDSWAQPFCGNAASRRCDGLARPSGGFALISLARAAWLRCGIGCSRRAEVAPSCVRNEGDLWGREAWFMSPVGIYCLMAFYVATIGGAIVWRFLCRRDDKLEPQCGSCGYSARGLPTSICPECGGDLNVVGIAQPPLFG